MLFFYFINHVIFYFTYERRVEWIVCLSSNRKKWVSHNWTHGINFKCCCCVVFLIKGGPPNFYAENNSSLSFFFFPWIPFCLQQSSLAVLHPSSSLVMRHQDSKHLLLSPFRQDLNNDTKIPHPGQSHNAVIYMRASA